MNQTEGKWQVGTAAGRPIIVMDSISYIGSESEGAIVISASHGGTSAARYVENHPAFLVTFNDAGVGKDRAGIVALPYLEARSIAAVAIAHTSARIGDGQDTWEHGCISHINRLAKELGLAIGLSVKEMVVHLS